MELKNYRSCKKTAVNLHSTLSALIGVNGSGKTNFLKGLLLLKKIARIPPRYRPDEEFVESSCKIKATFVVEQKQLPFEAVIKYTTNERNIDEEEPAPRSGRYQTRTEERPNGSRRRDD